MSAHAYQKWYWRDYLADTLDLSCEEHGAYILILGAYWMNEGPLPADEKFLQKVTKNSSHKWKKVWPAVRKKFQEKDGLLWHKRMQADIEEMAEISAKSRAAARKRWDKEGSKRNADASKKSMRTHMRTASQSESESESDSIGMHDQESLFGDESRPQCQKQQDGCESEDESFKRFYDAYPRKVGRGQARKAYKTALKKVNAGTLQRAVEAFASISKGKEPQYIKHPSTWLNGECWADEELKGAVAPGAGGDGSGSGRFDWRWAMTEWRKTGMWYAPGEPPGNPGCRVPLEILREFGF